MPIASRRNPQAKEWRQLRRPEVARAAERVFVEGPHPVLQALESGLTAEAVIVCPQLAKPDTIELVRQRAGESVRLWEVTREVFEYLSERDGPSGIAAVMPLRLCPLSELEPDSLVIALWRVENPGNLGTILRTANAFGASGVILVDNCTNPYHTAVVKASMGAVFHTPLAVCTNLTELVRWCRGHSLVLTGTSARARDVSPDWAPHLPLVLLFGSEGDGLPPEASGFCDEMIRIPMFGINTSLNLATAVGILSYLAVAGSRGDQPKENR
ncbi:MAG: RNA methyltransferase [Bacillota bacterium]